MLAGGMGRDVLGCVIFIEHSISRDRSKWAKKGFGWPSGLGVKGFSAPVLFFVAVEISPRLCSEHGFVVSFKDCIIAYSSNKKRLLHRINVVSLKTS